MAELRFEPATPASAVRQATNSTMKPGLALVSLKLIFFYKFTFMGSGLATVVPEFMHPKLKPCIQPGNPGEIFCCILDFSFKLV